MLVVRPLLVFFLMALPAIALAYFHTRDTRALNQRTIDAIRRGSGGDAAADFLRLQNDIFEALLSWTFLLFVFGLCLAIAWACWAAVKEKQVKGPADKSSAQPIWWAGLIAQMLVATLVYVGAIARLGLTGEDGFADAGRLWIDLLVIAGLSLLAYWIATGWAAGETMRPSVPLANRLDRAGGGAR